MDDALIPASLNVWMLQSQLNGADPGVVQDLLRQSGYDESIIAALHVAFTLDPKVKSACSTLLDDYKRLQWLLRLYEMNTQLLPEDIRVPRCSAVSPTDFLERFYAPNRPVIITDWVSHWPAYTLWDSAYLSQKWGTMSLEYTKTYRDGELMMKRYEHASLAEFLAAVDSVGEANDYYMTSYNNVYNAPLVTEMIADLGPMLPYLDPLKLTPTDVMPWIGPKGTHSGLHIDPANALLCQVKGRKHVKLSPPTSLPYFYLDNDYFSPVNLNDPGFAERYPEAAKAPVIDVMLNPGEALFLPVGWWHQVLAMDASISVTLTNFIWPNDYPSISHMFPELTHNPKNSVPVCDSSTTGG